MNKFLLISIVFITFLQSCASHALEQDKELSKAYKERMESPEIKNCAKNGGEVKRAGMMGLPHCVITYPDAGKPCKSSRECTKSCLVIDKPVRMGEEVTGECQHTNLNFGCSTPVENGVAGATLCVD